MNLFCTFNYCGIEVKPKRQDIIVSLSLNANYVYKRKKLHNIFFECISKYSNRNAGIWTLNQTILISHIVFLCNLGLQSNESYIPKVFEIMDWAYYTPYSASG